MQKKWILVLIILAVVLLFGGYWFYQRYFFPTNRSRKVFEFIRNPGEKSNFLIPALSTCGDAPFIFPTTGMIGFIWDDSFRPGHRHQGIDIFSGTEVGETAVYAAYDGYLTRRSDWVSTVIVRIPADPLQPDRQVWIYYTHMADASGNSLIVPEFPPGTSEVFIRTGTLLGYQGNYSGKPGNPTGVHLHFSIVKDDGRGRFMNELEISNTLDPSQYFGMALNANENLDQIPTCDHQ